MSDLKIMPDGDMLININKLSHHQKVELQFVISHFGIPTVEPADLIERQQARIAELERSVSSSEMLRANQRETIRKHQNREQELAATVERLREPLSDVFSIIRHERGDDEIAENNGGYYDDFLLAESIMQETPRQNLNAVKRDAYAKGYEQGAVDHSTGFHDYNYLEKGLELANQRYPDKEGNNE